jgi:hypothetical protein
MPDNLKLIRDKQLICRDSCRKRHSLLDNSNQTSSFGHKRIFLRCSQILRNLSQTVYESSILGFHQWHPPACKIGTGNLPEGFRYGMLFIMFFGYTILKLE